MSDLVERLHAMANVPEVDFDPVVINEAADRIAALEAALRRIDAINDSPARFSEDIHNVCCAALAEGQEK